ncbi:hypothetical protein GJV07_15480 [Enterobacteriaceae bacterium RIT711]|nr:hypothetical protein [Enterobacteriaceae bacterium RIT711]
MTTSPLKVEDSRADFEAWMTDEQWFHGSDFEWDDGRNCYSQFGIHIAYKAWQASRAAIVVELPEPYDDGHGNLWLPQDATANGIRAAGITVKGD